MSYYQTIYDHLRKSGITKAGALGLLGNWDCESNCEPNRLQDDFSPGRILSKQYTQNVDSGAISRDQFQRDQKGYGLAQWTYFSRKAALFDAAKSSGKSIGDTILQVDFALKELNGEYSGLLAFMKTTDDIYSACSRVCKEFERPAINNVDARYQAALRIEKQIDASAKQEGKKEESKPNNKCWPPRMIDKNMSGPDVEVLQAILKARGYGIHLVSGKFDDLLDKETRKFQRDQGLAVDGVVGPMTWAALLGVSK